MLQKTAILTITFLLACAYAQNSTYYDEPGYSSSEPETHIVKRGETLFRIAKKYGMTVTEIKRANQLRSDIIKIGQRLEVNSGDSNKRYANRSQDNVRGLESGGQIVEGSRTFYKVQRDDNIYAIASEFGVLVDEIREWNGISTVRAGQTLIVGKNDVARIPSYRPAPQEDSYARDSDLYRKSSYRTSSRSLNSRTRNQSSNARYSKRDEEPSYAENMFYKKRESTPSYKDSYNNRRTADTYDSQYTKRERNPAQSNRNRRYADEERGSKSFNSSYNNSSFSNARKYDNQADDYDNRSNARYKDDYRDDYEDDYQNNRMPRAADIKYGGRAEVLYEYVGDIDKPDTGDRFNSRQNARTAKPNPSNSNQINQTGDFTELRSKKATNNRFYAFHNSLPIGSKVKMLIPQNEGYVEVEIIDRLPSYERVMIGLSPACTAILEGAGNPHIVTISSR